MNNNDAIKIWMEAGRETIENAANDSTTSKAMTSGDWVGIIIALMGIIFLFGVTIWLIIDYFKDSFSLIHMKYEDFLKDWGDRGYSNFFYKRKLKRLSKNKSTSEIKNDIDKATTFRELFIKLYLSRRKKELKVLSTEDLLKEDYDHLYEEEMYKRVVRYRLHDLERDELIDLFKRESFDFYKDIFYKVYEEKLEDDLYMENVNDLVYMFDNYTDEILTRSRAKDIVCKVLYTKARRLSKYKRMYFIENAPKEILRKINLYC